MPVIIETAMTFVKFGVRKPLLDKSFEPSERRLRFGVLRRGVPKRKIEFLIVNTFERKMKSRKEYNTFRELLFLGDEEFYGFIKSFCRIRIPLTFRSNIQSVFSVAD